MSSTEKQVKGKKFRLVNVAALCFYFFFFFFVVLAASAVDAATSDATAGPCTSTLASDATKLIPFSTSSLQCVPVWKEQDFTLMYAKDGPNTWNFVLSAPDAGGYVAVGFSPSGDMVGSSAVAGWMGADGSGMARQYYLAAENSADCKPDTGNLTLAKGTTVILRSQSRLYLAFQLANATEPPQNKLVYAVGPKGKLPGKDLLLAEHSSMVPGTVDFQAAEAPAANESTATKANETVAGSCTSKLTSDAAKLMPFGTSSLKCIPVWSSQDFTLMYAQDDPNTWSFILSAPDSGGYIAMGFSPRGKMVGSSAVVGWITDTGSGMARQYYLAAENSADCKPDTGNLTLAKGKTVILRSQSRLYLAFQLANATEPPQNKLVYAVGPKGKLPGKDLLLAEHSSMVPGTVDFQAAEAPAANESTPAKANETVAGSCNSKLTSDAAKLMPFGTSSLKCIPAWSSQDFTLMYSQDDPNTWSFILSAPDSGGYIAMGFSPRGKMVGSSAVVGWITGTGSGMARQYYLAGETSGACKPDTGSLPLVRGKTLILRSQSRLYLAFQLNATAPPQNKLVYAVGPKGSIPGPDLLLAEHSDMVTGSVDFQSGVSSQDGGDGGSDTLQTSHGLLALLGWGVVVPIGIMVARYAKRWDPHWFYGHMLVQFVGYGAGIAAVVTGFKLEDKNGDDVGTHKAIGIVILVLGTLQVLAFLARPDKASKARRYWNWYHHYVGRAAAALAVANIFYGLSLADEERSWSVGYGVFLGVWVLLAFSFEICRCCSAKRK